MQVYLNEDVKDENAKSGGSTGVSILSAVQIILLNQIYSKMAITLNDQENHRLVSVRGDCYSIITFMRRRVLVYIYFDCLFFGGKLAVYMT